MPQFFINRPVFAWVIALFIVLIGVISIPQLPISRYPSVAPVSVSIYAAYPGATPQTLNDSVISLVERELSGVKTYCTLNHQLTAQEVHKLPPPSNRAQMRNLPKLMCKIALRQSNHAYLKSYGRAVCRLSRRHRAF